MYLPQVESNFGFNDIIIRKIMQGVAHLDAAHATAKECGEKVHTKWELENVFAA